MSIQSVWSLSATASEGVNVARRLFEAANNDNVQLLPLLACEKFGSTLAICTETRRKIETTVVPTPPSNTIGFLQASVGYSSHDSTAVLGRSMAGVQFLALMATLVTTMEPHEASQALEQMLHQSAADTTLLPTLKQLRDLAESIRPRFRACGFAESVSGWHQWLHHQTAQNCGDGLVKEQQYCPSSKGLEHLVNAFRQLCRVGESQVNRVSIHTLSSGSWIVAFTKWCLGMPPSVFLPDNQPPLIQEGSKVDLYLVTRTLKPLELKVSVHFDIGSPIEMIVPQERGSIWGGMVDIASFGSRYMFDEGLNSELARRTLHQVIPNAVSEAFSKLHFRSNNSTHNATDDEALRSHKFAPFRSEQDISKVIELLLGFEHEPSPSHLTWKDASGLPTTSEPKAPERHTPKALPSMEKGLLVTDLPLAERYSIKLGDTCSCIECCRTRQKVVDGCPETACKKDIFLESIAELTSVILVLSLFEKVEDLRIRAGTFEMRHRSLEDEKLRHLESLVLGILKTGEPAAATVWELLDLALSLVAHDVGSDIEQRSWIVSSSKGQVVYPALFETQNVEKRGFLILCWLPGILVYKGDAFARVLGYTLDPQRDWGYYERPMDATSYDRLKDQFKGVRFQWNLESQAGFLNVTMSMDIDQTPTSLLNPGAILDNLAGILEVGRCPHDRNFVSPTHQIRFCRFTSPMCPEISYTMFAGSLAVVPVDGSENLRFFSLASLSSPAVFRGNACIECSIKFCVENGRPVLIL